MAGIYVHIPFCASKCLYCAFYSSPVKKVDADRFVYTVVSELEARKSEITENVNTVYFGGGTPSMLPPESIAYMLRRFADIAGDYWTPEEITIEANPDNICPETVKRWKEAGINRVSLGVQSFNDDELRKCGRRHTASQAVEAINIIKEWFDNLSIDLICGLPSQTDDSWAESVEKLISISPEHISAYILETDGESALARLLQQNRLTLPDEEVVAQRFRYLCHRLSEAGYDRYEISNFSLFGKESRHNSSYWAGIPYIGLGPAAASYDGKRIRRVNAADTGKYLAFPASPPHSLEFLSDEDLRTEYLLTRLRTRRGVSLTDFEKRFRGEEKEKLMKSALRFISDSSLILKEDRLLLSEKGAFISDYILSSLV